MGNCQNVCDQPTGQIQQYQHHKDHSYLTQLMQFQAQPSTDYATYKGTKHYQIPCSVNHILEKFQPIKFQKGQEQGIEKQGYYFIESYKVYYSGQWKHGKPQGQGQLIFKDGSALRGWFQNGVCNGPQNLYVMEDGTYYLGSIRHNMFDGKGKLVAINGYSIQGDWKDNIPNGYCQQQFENGDHYEGLFVKGEKQTQKGKYEWANHPYYQKYEGGFQSNKIYGNGTLYKKNGDILTGYFGDKNINDCKYQSIINGVQYQGKIIEGQLNGQGTLSFKDGRYYEGTFKNGKMHGKGCIVDKQGKKKTGFWFEGKRVRNMKNMDDDQMKYILEVVQNTLKKTKQGKSFKQYAKSDLKVNPLTQKFVPYIIEQYDEKKILGDKYMTFQFGADLLLITNLEQQIFDKLPDNSDVPDFGRGA